jgi:hypothetical protein
MAKNKGGKKKTDDDLQRELKLSLDLDITILENNIHFEQEREAAAFKELEKISQEIILEEQKISQQKNEGGRKILNESEKLRETDTENLAKVKAHEASIKDADDEIKKLLREVERLSEVYNKEVEEKKAAINEQRKLLDDMSNRFQHILQRTANKLQERVNTAGI